MLSDQETIFIKRAFDLDTCVYEKSSVRLLLCLHIHRQKSFLGEPSIVSEVA